MNPVIERLRGGLIVSCQAEPGDPLYGSAHMAAMARAAEMGGAVAIRANYPQDIAAIKAAVRLPVIGLYKKLYESSPVYISPTMAEVEAIVAAGADMIAVAMTNQPRPDGCTNRAFLAEIRRAYPSLPVMADIATLEEGLQAAELGVNLVSTTLSGYTPYSLQQSGPDIQLVQELSSRTTTPVVAEGRISTPLECKLALEAGAFAVVVGSAITRPQIVTSWFAQALRQPNA